MKLLKLFKRESSSSSDSKNTNVQKLEKNQLEKVIGGAGSIPDSSGRLDNRIDQGNSTTK